MSRSEFSGFEIGRRMLEAFRVAQEVTGHNIANASNPAYSRQRIHLQAAKPVNIPSTSLDPAQLGGGVVADRVERFRDQFVDSRRTALNGGVGHAATLATGLDAVQRALGEPSETGLRASLDGVFSAFASLSTRPEDPALRGAVVNALDAAATRFRDIQGSFLGLQRQADQQLRAELTQVNGLAQTVADLNTQIAKTLALQEQPNDLLDQRQAALAQLGSLAGVAVSNMDNGMVSVSLGGHWLVSQDKAEQIQAQPDPLRAGLSLFTFASTGADVAPSSGSLLAGLELRDQDLPAAQAELDRLALAFRDDLNALQASGYALGAAAPGGAQALVGTGALDLRVDPALLGDPALLAAAQSPSAQGDGRQAAAFAALAAQISPGLGASFADGIATWTSQLGSAQALAAQQQASQEALSGQLEQLTQSVSGVNLDEEALHLAEFQHAYEAGAKYVAVLDSMMQTLLNDLVR